MLRASIEKYQRERTAIFNKTKRQHQGIFGLPIGISFDDKMHAVTKVLNDFNGEQVEYTPADLSALRDRGLGCIIRQHNTNQWPPCLADQYYRVLRVAIEGYRAKRAAEYQRTNQMYATNFFGDSIGFSYTVKMESSLKILEAFTDPAVTFTDNDIEVLRNGSLGDIMREHMQLWPEAYRLASQHYTNRNYTMAYASGAGGVIM